MNNIMFAYIYVLGVIFEKPSEFYILAIFSAAHCLFGAILYGVWYKKYPNFEEEDEKNIELENIDNNKEKLLNEEKK